MQYLILFFVTCLIWRSILEINHNLEEQSFFVKAYAVLGALFCMFYTPTVLLKAIYDLIPWHNLYINLSGGLIALTILVAMINTLAKHK